MKRSQATVGSGQVKEVEIEVERADWPLVSVLVASYNRAETLATTLAAFRACCTYPNYEVVIADDHSKRSQLEQILAMPADTYVIAGQNRGLGGNNNQGIRAARGDYHFYLQDDWECTERGDWMQECLAVLESHPQVGLVHCRIMPHATNYTTEQMSSGHELRLMDFEQPPGPHSIWVYSDGPALKRPDFHEKVGWFVENTDVAATEVDMCHKFLAQREYTCAAIDFRRGEVQLFEHIGYHNTTRPELWRVRWEHRLRRSIVGRMAIDAYHLLPTGIRRRLHGSAWRTP